MWRDSEGLADHLPRRVSTSVDTLQTYGSRPARAVNLP